MLNMIEVMVKANAILQRFDDGTMRVINGDNVWIVPGTWTAQHEMED